MVMILELKYQVMGFGPWTIATVSHDIAIRLAEEYSELGWPVEVNGSEYKKELAA